MIFVHLEDLHCQGRLLKQTNVEEYEASFKFKKCTLNEFYIRP